MATAATVFPAGADLNDPNLVKVVTALDGRAIYFPVWVGNDDHSPMNGVTGGSLPATIWKRFMEQAAPPRPRPWSAWRRNRRCRCTIRTPMRLRPPRQTPPAISMPANNATVHSGSRLHVPAVLRRTAAILRAASRKRFPPVQPAERKSVPQTRTLRPVRAAGRCMVARADLL